MRISLRTIGPINKDFQSSALGKMKVLKFRLLSQEHPVRRIGHL